MAAGHVGEASSGVMLALLWLLALRTPVWMIRPGARGCG
jgi:hypothetical protein